MDLIDELRAFVATAQTGSFTAAADQIGVSNRLTSKYVAELEARLGTRLFQRTTRKVGLTPAGEDLLARAPALLDELDDMLSDMTEGARGFGGVIRVSAPVTFGEAYLGEMLGRFAAANPALTIDLRLSDRYADLAAEGIDLAFRVGMSDMLSVKSKKLGEISSAVIASPAYLAEHGTPQTPSDLAGHNCIMDGNLRQFQKWTIGGVQVPVNGRFKVNSARAVVKLAQAGLGIAHAPRFALGDALDDGSLVRLFSDYSCETHLLSAVYLEGRTLPRKVRALIDFAIADLRENCVL